MSLTYPTFTRQKYGATLHDTQRTIDAAGIVVRKLGTYLAIPEFSIQSTWRGASEIIGKFNFSLDNNFTIQNIIPQDNFCACISWKPTSETIVRYKLWEDVGEILYVDLYNGEKIGSDFAIEIWNIKPTSADSDLPVTEDGFLIELEDGSATVELEEGGSSSEAQSLITEEGEEVITEEDESIILEEELDSDALIGTVDEISYGGSSLVHTSIMQLPTSPFCNTSNIALGGTPDLCADITFILDTFNPFDGDYYTKDGDCGETILVKGPTFVGSEFKLLSTDDTWHRIFIAEFGGRKHLFIDQDDTTPGDAPFFHIRSITDRLGYKVHAELDAVSNRHRVLLEQESQVDFDYVTAYFLLDGLYYGLRAANIYGQRTQLTLSQTGVSL